MRTIHKYPLHVVDRQRVQLPKGADILCVQTQRNRPCLWALVDPSLPAEEWSITTRGTGHPCDAESLHYVGTYQLDGGALVFHVFAKAVDS